MPVVSAPNEMNNSEESHPPASHETNERSSESADDSESSNTESDSDSESEEETKTIPNLIFRSYKPFSPELQKKMIPGPSILEDLQWVDAELRLIVENCRKSEESLANIVPKKINWDLKRDLAPKLSILNSKTQRAIAELVREKISTESLAE